jgi:hypothetical protein
MKMDATQKRKMRKVAIAHFVLTVIYIFNLFYMGGIFSGLESIPYWILQPQFSLVLLKFQIGIMFFHTHSASLTMFFIGVCIALIPLWSICFGWFYVKFTNWLNHFPVLGKKVFDLRFNHLTIQHFRLCKSHPF